MKEIYRERSLSMKEADQNCAADPDWFRKTTFTGMAVNPADFADTLSGLSDKLDYISECKADTLYLTDLFQATYQLLPSHYPGDRNLRRSAYTCS